MNYFNIISKVHHLRTIDMSMLSSLYVLSQKSISTLLLLSLFLTYFLYESLSNTILIWEGIVIFISMLRLYLAYCFKKDPNKYSLETWHILFAFFAFLTALLFAALSLIAIPQIDNVHQIFIVAVLIGFTAGAMSSLSPDIRIAIGYITIILWPLVAVLLKVSTTMHIVLALMVILYFISQIFIMIKTYQQTVKMQEQENQIHMLKEKQALFNNLFKEANICIFSYDTNLHMIDCNDQACKLFNTPYEELIKLDLNQHPNKMAVEILSKALHEGSQIYSGPLRTIKGNKLWIEGKCFPYTDSKGKTIGAIGIIENKTKEHNALDELEFLAQHDPLTNLLNRRGFKEYMEELVAGEKHQKQYSLLFYLDLNQFKGINDSLGHTIGDEVLLSVSQRLVCVLDDICKISRLGGDEFVVIAPYISTTKDEAKKEAKKYEKQLKDIFLESFIIEELHLHIKSSIGIIIIEPNYENIEEIIRHADITMYQAKNSNEHISYYNEKLDIKQKKLFELQHELAYGVERNQFDMFFQPIVNLENDTLYSAEALIRWNHPNKGLLSPEAFIPLAIKAGLLSQISWWVVDSVCKKISQWKKEGQWKLAYVSININAQQLIENNFATTFFSKLKKYGLETKDIMIEITERSLIDNFDNTQDVINALRSKGVRCAIDDFGIGYSSLSYLKKLSFNTLKIDRVFIKDIVSKPKDLLLISTILDIGRQFNYNLVIEGIEEEKQKELLLELDVNLRYQGYYLSKPLHSEAFKEAFLI